MKRMLFILSAAILGLTGLNAQTLEKRTSDVVKASEVQKALVSPQFIQGQGVVDKTDFVKKTNVYEMAAKAGKAVTYNSAAGMLEDVGTFATLGVENWDGNMQWEVDVYKDDTDPNKYWFVNLLNLPLERSEDLSATLKGDVLTFDTDVKAYANSLGTEGVFCTFVNGYSDIDLTAKVNYAEGKLEFSSGFGCCLSVGGTTWFTIIKSATMYDPYYLPPMPGIEEMQGALWMGYTNDLGSYLAAIVCLPAFHNYTFKDATKKKDNIESKLWEVFEATEVENGSLMGYSYDSTDDVMEIPATYHEYINLDLNLTTTAGVDNIYRLGHGKEKTSSAGDTKLWDSYIYFSGETLVLNNEPVLFSNCNIDNGLMIHSSAEFEYYGTGGKSSSLVAVYDAPLNGHLYFEGLQIFLGKVKGYSSSTRFAVDVVKIHGWERDIDEETGLIIDFPDFGDELEVIASSSVTYANGYKEASSGSTGSYGVLRFEEFEAVDEFGITSPVDYLEVDHAIAFIFTGYNIPNASMGVFSATHDFVPEGKFSSFFVTPEGGISTWTDKQSPMAFALIGGAYSYLHSDVTDVNVPAEGGDVTVVLQTMRPDVELSSSLPEGVTVKSQVDDFSDADQSAGEYYNDYKSTITLSIAANEKRTFDLTWHSPGAYETITFRQGGDQAIKDTAANKEVNAVREGDNFRVTYPAAANALSVYNVAGQRVAKYNLNSNGSDVIPADKLAKGVYIFKFEGTNASVKVVK